jgi:hypothetical protein
MRIITDVFHPQPHKALIYIVPRSLRPPPAHTINPPQTRADNLQRYITERMASSELPENDTSIFSHFSIDEIHLQLGWWVVDREVDLPQWRQHVYWIFDALQYCRPDTKKVTFEYCFFPKFISERFLRLIGSRGPALEEVSTKIDSYRMLY